MLTKEQWETVAGLIEGDIENTRLHMEGWKEGSSPYRRLERELKGLEAIAAEFANLAELGNLPYDETDEEIALG